MTNTERLLLCAANASPDGYLELPAPRVTMDAMLQRGWFEVCNTRYRITDRGRDEIVDVTFQRSLPLQPGEGYAAIARARKVLNDA